MNDAGLQRRARRFAALGEPVRLEIVERLALGDLSPSELAHELGLASNLLAFHLKVLTDAGLVRRTTSQGDRRRTYIQLQWDDPDVAALVPITAPAREPVERVAFVCTANSARSQLAAASWKKLSRIPGVSAGTHPAAAVHPLAIETGRRHGLGLVRARTAHVDDTVRSGDLVVAVCDSAHEELVEGQGHAAQPSVWLPGVWLHWAIPDPALLNTSEAFESAYAELDQRLRRLASAICA